MKKRILLLVLAALLLVVPLGSALAQSAPQYDHWITDAIADALGFTSLDALIAHYGFGGQPLAVVLRTGSVSYNEGGVRYDEVDQEGELVFPEDTITVEFTDAQMWPLNIEMDAVLPLDYLVNLPGSYSWIEIRYESETRGETRYPAFTVMSTDFAIATYEDVYAFSGVLDMTNYITATIDDYVSAHIEGSFDGGIVIIDSQFAAADVYTTVTYIP